jgi:hypothetical protein
MARENILLGCGNNLLEGAGRGPTQSISINRSVIDAMYI